MPNVRFSERFQLLLLQSLEDDMDEARAWLREHERLLAVALPDAVPSTVRVVDQPNVEQVLWESPQHGDQILIYYALTESEIVVLAMDW